MNSKTTLWSRRDALRKGTAATVLATALSRPQTGVSAVENVRDALQKIQLGIVADVHQDIIHDGWARLRQFVDASKQRSVDAVIQLGDFALPHRRNQAFLDVWNEYEGPRYHVLGNHDTDSGFSKAQTMEWWGMPQRFYSFDLGGWHFIVLDGNDKNPGKWSGYVRYIAEEQRNWLAKDLAATNAPTMVFSHQKLETEGGVANSADIRTILDQANQAAGWQKVYACLCGHHHTDRLTEIGGIRYIHVNSMSYKWVGGENKRQRFADHIEAAYPLVSHTVPYRDPLYTMLTLDPKTGSMTIEGKETTFVPPTPDEMNLSNSLEMRPMVTARELKVLG